MKLKFRLKLNAISMRSFVLILVVLLLSGPAVHLNAQITIEYREVPYVDPGPHFLHLSVQTGPQPVKLVQKNGAANGTMDTVIFDGVVKNHFGAYVTFIGSDPERNFTLEYGFGGRLLNLDAVAGEIADSKIRKVGIFDFLLGVRYFPAKPTMSFGNQTVRFTAAGLIGLEAPSYYVTADLNGGFLFARKDKGTGLYIGATYRPIEQEFDKTSYPGMGAHTDYHYSLASSWGLKASLIFGFY